MKVHLDCPVCSVKMNPDRSLNKAVKVLLYFQCTFCKGTFVIGVKELKHWIKRQ